MPNHKKVIPFSVSRWRFFDYADDVQSWYLGLSEDGQDIFEGLLKVNSKAPDPRHWSGSKMLQGALKNERIWEWTFFSNDRQQRILGVFGEERCTAIFLIGCSHKGKIYSPSNCLETALKRARSITPGANFRERQVRSDF